jgi:hypothetical protein
MPNSLYNSSIPKHACKTSSSSSTIRPSCLLYNLKLIVYECTILLVAHVSRLLHIRRHGRIVLLDAALVVASKRVAAEVRVGGIEIRFCFFRCFGVCL